ncbi:hypothetical protein LIER_00526 [Lithospermum erythrorhizon]|uniref:HAT C-terminal dimerisation domain-containing protein n=1 Tax=Lithospermum erythrorhizon TaxID=34254 RepID=A0AAV3NJ70_LITER
MKKAMSLVNKISLTTYLWWSGEQKIGYMTVTCHFIDVKWQLHKRVLAFTNVPPPHSTEVLARELLRVMDDWHIRDKVVSISVDNGSSNDNCIARLKVDFKENGSFLYFLPDQLDWEIVYDIYKFLEVFADVTTIISGRSYPTVNLFLVELYMVKVLIDENCKRARNLHLQMLASQMKVKYEKYWSQSNILISIGVVLDPRYKMVFIAWVYPFLYTLGDDAKKREDELSSHLFSLFKFGVKFDVLTWWMANEAKYHILSTMAKDILSIPITTVALEATFSAGKRVIDLKRASMTTKTVEMLLCGGDWIKEMYGIKRGQSQSILEALADDPLEFHFGEERVTTSTSKP